MGNLERWCQQYYYYYRLIAAAAPHSDFLQAIRCVALETRLDDTSPRIAVALRLGATMCAPHTCVGGQRTSRQIWNTRTVSRVLSMRVASHAIPRCQRSHEASKVFTINIYYLCSSSQYHQSEHSNRILYLLTLYVHLLYQMFYNIKLHA